MCTAIGHSAGQYQFLKLRSAVSALQISTAESALLLFALQVVKLKGTDEVYALKILNKWEMLKRHQVRNTTCIGYVCMYVVLAGFV